MALTININGLTLCHRSSDGITHNTLPDVCKTPEKGIPLPYDNEAYSVDIANGTVTVSADGGNMAAKLGCIFAKSIFDEGGSMGGIISGTFIAEADFITHSFDVFLEGSPACRLTDKMWMNHRNTVNMSGLGQRPLSAALINKICDAICKCSTVNNILLPTKLQVAEALDEFIDAATGQKDTTIEKASDAKKIHRRQKCFAGEFANGDPWYGADPKDPKVLVEVPFRIPTEVLLSETGRTTSAGATAPASVVRALSQARGNPGTVVIWDMAVVKNPNLPATWDNIEKIVEIKFAGDTPTPNQSRALENGEVNSKVQIVKEEDCACGLEKEQRDREINRLIEKFGENLKNLLPFFPGGGRRPRGGFGPAASPIPL